MPRDPVHVLFLCRGNSARSIIAEAILARDGVGRFRGFSAGNQPRGEVHPLTLELLAALGVPTRGLRSKSLQEFAGSGAPSMSAVIVLCDDAPAESSPVLPGSPVTARWAIPDPTAFAWDDAAARSAFLEVYLALQARIARLVALPLDELDRESLREKLEEIGRLPGRPKA